jgi:hypothetical protein
MKQSINKATVAAVILALSIICRAGSQSAIPIHDIMEFKSSNEKDIRAYLRSKCGSAANVSWQQSTESYQVIVEIATINVYFNRGRVWQIKVSFAPPIPLSSAFDFLGLDSLPPSESSSCSWQWTNVFKGMAHSRSKCNTGVF